MIPVMDNKLKLYSLFNQLLLNQLLYSNGLMQTDTPSERWTMEARFGGMEQIGKNMLDLFLYMHNFDWFFVPIQSNCDWNQ